MEYKSHTQDIPDSELVERAKTGDKTAFGVLVKRWQNVVYTQCFRYVGEKIIAEELAQDIFIAVYRGLPRFREESKFSTWLFRIVINHCKNKSQYSYRRHRKTHEPLEGNNPDNPRQLSNSNKTPEESAQSERLKKVLQEGLAELEEKQRAILILRDIQELSYEEIADILNIPKGTVKSRIHRARLDLSTVLGGKISQDDL